MMISNNIGSAMILAGYVLLSYCTFMYAFFGAEVFSVEEGISFGYKIIFLLVSGRSLLKVGQ